VQRDRVIACAAMLEMDCRVATFGLAALLDADEVFLVNSVIGLWPVRELEQRRWTDFATAEQVRKGMAASLIPQTGEFRKP
jgi:4-amino-4-deoxychorismate lyase